MFHFNSEFEREIDGEKLSPKMQISVAAMAALFCAALPEEETIYSEIEVNNEFYQYLGNKGLSSAKLVSEISSDTKHCYWGISRNIVSQYPPNQEIPSPDVIKELNSRVFQAKLAQKYQTGIPGSRLIHSESELKTTLEDAKFPYVLKPVWGNAGSGFLHSEQYTTDELIQLAGKLLSRDSHLLFEPWLEKSDDIATLAEIKRDGKVVIHGHHYNMSNRAGSFYANIIDAKSPLITAHEELLSNTAKTVAKELYANGYWGYFGLDAISYQTNEMGSTIATAIDINVRHTIANITYGIRKKLKSQTPGMLRFIGKRKAHLPDSYESLLALEDSLCQKGEKIIQLSPLNFNLGKELRAPARALFYLESESINDLLQLDLSFRKAVLKKAPKY